MTITSKSCVSIVTRALVAPAVLLLSIASASASTTFQLTANNIQIDQPAPLFTTDTVSGSLTISGTNGPGGAFGISQIEGLSFNFGGIIIALPDIEQPGGDITAFGNISPDGKTITAIDLRFDLPTTFGPCSLTCDGQLEIGNFDNSNFVAINDPDTETLSLVQYDASLSAVPEPVAWIYLMSGLGAVGATLRVRRRLLTFGAQR
jgi:hypothetical protein